MVFDTSTPENLTDVVTSYSVPVSAGFKAAGIKGALIAGLGTHSLNTYNLSQNAGSGPSRKESMLGSSRKALNISDGRRSRIGSAPAVKRSKTSRDTQGVERDMIDKAMIPSLGRNRLTGVVLRTGKRLKSYDPIAPFLANLLQNGTATTQFSGIITAQVKRFTDAGSQGVRTVIAQNFRHRFAQNCTNTGAFPTLLPFPPGPSPQYNVAYPTVTAGNVSVGTVLTPEAPAFGLVNDTAPSGSETKISGPYHQHYQYENCWSPLNICDLEDMSWNLNKLKLTTNSTAYNNSGGNRGQSTDNGHLILPNVAVWKSDFHRCYSAIENQNFINSMKPDSETVQPAYESTYSYQSVLKGGNIKYQFSNKQSTGARVEVIVYRMKQNKNQIGAWINYAAADPFTVAASSGGNLGNPLNNIVPPIAAGYMNTCEGKLGTDNLGGRDPNPRDIVDNPEFPLLPVLKKTINARESFKEVSRTAFALPAGGTRELDIMLEGIKYTPGNSVNQNSLVICTGQSGDVADLPGCLDKHSYTVVISVCGVKMTRNIAAGLAAPSPDTMNPNWEPPSINLGDVHCGASVEYTATYTENLGACCYKQPTKNMLNNSGKAKDVFITQPQPTAVTRPVTILPIDDAVRGTNVVTRTVDSNLVNSTTVTMDTGEAS